MMNIGLHQNKSTLQYIIVFPVLTVLLLHRDYVFLSDLSTL